MNKLNQSVDPIKTKEDFFQAPAKIACMYAYTMFKAGKWPKPVFDERLRE